MINPIVSLWQGIRQSRAVHAAVGVPPALQLRHMVLMRRATGMARAEYYRYRLWRPELDEVARLTYTCQRERRHSEYLTNREGRTQRWSGKSTQATLLAGGGLRIPAALGSIGLGDGAGEPIADFGSFRDFLARHGDRPMVFKPEHGSQGQGIMVIVAASATAVVLLSGTERSTADLWREVTAGRGAAWRIEQWVEAHPALAGFRPGATPTLRVLTILLDAGPVLQSAVLKLPITDQGVDNLHAGNLAAGVDLSTGIVGPATDTTGQPWYDHHPVSKLAITGLRVPHWDAVRDMALRGAELLAPARALGWDITVDADGPVVLESNMSWGEDLTQLPDQRGVMHGALLRLLHEVGASRLLAARRRLSPAWAAFEREQLAGQ